MNRTKRALAAIGRLLAKAQAAQTKYWELLRALETACGIEFDGEDLSLYSVEDFLEEGVFPDASRD